MVILRFGGRDFRLDIVSSVLTATWLTKCGAAVLTIPLHPLPAGTRAECNSNEAKESEARGSSFFSIVAAV